MYLIQINGAQKFSQMCMCVECTIQALKQINGYVSFPVGTVALKIASGLPKENGKT